MAVKSPVQWFGGKGNMVAKIVPLLESIPHSYYVEPFGGGASIILNKAPVSVETYNDIDSVLYDFFTVLRTPELFDKFYKRVLVMPSSRQMYNEFNRKWRSEEDLIERVAMWFYLRKLSFSGHHSWANSVSKSNRGMASTVNTYLATVDKLPEFLARLQRIQIENDDFANVIKRYDATETLFYLDPPYVHDTRISGKYEHEMTREQHVKLTEMLLGISGLACLSAYESDVYQPLLDAGWQMIQWETSAHSAVRSKKSGIVGDGSANKKQKRVECMYVSPRAWPFVESAWTKSKYYKDAVAAGKIKSNQQTLPF